MPTQILMPALSPTMVEGTLAKWLVKEGDAVKAGDLLAEIETDKATMEFEAVDDGIVGGLLVAEGTEGVKVNTPIAVMLNEGESAAPIVTPPSPAPKSVDDDAVAGGNRKAAPPQPVQHIQPEDRVFATPLARRLAREKGLDLAAIQGTGPKGRIIKADIEGAAAPVRLVVGQAAKPASIPTPSLNTVAKIYADREYREIPLDGMRKTVAARLTESKQTIPHFYLRRDINLDALLEFRASLNSQLKARSIKLSVNDFIIKACALALQQVPAANSVWAGDRILQMTRSDVAVAVAVEGGLFTPVLLDADIKPISVISNEMKDLAARARDRKLLPHEYSGGSFAISNLGMYGIDSFDAVINPPHGSILAVGAGTKKPVVGSDDQITAATIMSVTFSVDHRVIDGVIGAEFLAAIMDNLEHPMAMLA